MPAHVSSGICHQRNGKPVASTVSLSAGDFKSAIRAACKELLEFFRILRMANPIAEQNHASFKIVSLPRMKKAVGCGQREHVVRISYGRWTPVVLARTGNPVRTGKQ